MPLGREKSELLFCLISERYDHASIIWTSNKYFSDWRGLFSDNVRLLPYGTGCVTTPMWCISVVKLATAELPPDNRPA